MKFKKTLALSATMLMTLAAVSCGGSNPSTEDNDEFFGADELIGQVEIDEETGLPMFDDEVVVKLWSITGEPDKSKYIEVVNDFNKKYAGTIRMDVTYVGHFDFYNNLDNTWQNDRSEMPDMLFMHNEKTMEYTTKGMLYDLDAVLEKAPIEFDFSKAYANIDRTNIYKGHRFAIPVDGHGFVTQFRQDIIKKNGLGFDGNTRFIPESRTEYVALLKALRTKADAGELLVRDINKGEDHAWKVADKKKFFPSYTQSADPDGLSALYVNGGSLLDAEGTTVTFQNSLGFQHYVTDQVERWNDGLIGEPGTNTESFSKGMVAMFPEGPWWVAQTYDKSYNNADLRTAGCKNSKGEDLHVSEEDANDPIISHPYVASKPLGWWTDPENDTPENANKWYGNGHSFSLTKRVTDANVAAAALFFARWFVSQDSKVEDQFSNLTKWCSSGHIPAWKNVYDSSDYQAELAKNMTLQALGDPKDLISMEPIQYESTLFNGFSLAITSVQEKLKSKDGCTVEQAIEEINKSAESTQAIIDSFNLLG